MKINRLAPLAVLTSVLFVGILAAKPVLAQDLTCTQFDAQLSGQIQIKMEEVFAGRSPEFIRGDYCKNINNAINLDGRSAAIAGAIVAPATAVGPLLGLLFDVIAYALTPDHQQAVRVTASVDGAQISITELLGVTTASSIVDLIASKTK